MKEPEEWLFHRMAKVHDFLEMSPGSQNLCANKKDSHGHHTQKSIVWYMSDTEEMVKGSWSLFQPDCAAAFKLSETSAVPPALSAKNLPEGGTQIINVRRIQTTNYNPFKSDKEIAPESISDTEDWLHSNGDLENPNDREDDCGADIESHIDQDNSIEDQHCPGQRDENTAPIVPRLIRPTRKLNRQAELVLVTVNTMKTRRNQWVKNKLGKMHQWFTSIFIYLVPEIQLEIYYVLTTISSLWISVDRQMYRRRNEAFGKIHRFLSCQSEEWKNVTALRFATWPHLNRSQRQQISSNHHESHSGWQQMLNWQFIKITVYDLWYWKYGN